MGRRIHIFIFALGLVLIPRSGCAQDDEIREEGSADVFLEEYTDEFQEKFFEALKQKGIENYDRAGQGLLGIQAVGFGPAIRYCSFECQAR